jgi:iron(III) transport system permease protein
MGTMAALVIAYVIRFQSLATGGISAGFERISPHLDMAARTLGSTSHDVMRQIHVPLLLGAMASAGLMVFVDTLKELPATLLLRPLNGETLATQLYAYASQGQFEQGAPMALMIVLIGLIPVIVLTYLTARHVKGRETPSMR